MLSCRDRLARHTDYLDGQLDTAAAEEFRAHLEACRYCARYDRVLRRGLKALAAQPGMQPPSDLMLQIEQRIALEDQIAAYRPIRSMASATIAVAAMLAFAAWIPVLMLAREDTNQTMTVTQTADSPVVSEIAWHGERAVSSPAQQHIHLVRRVAWAPTVEHHVIVPRYTPVVLEAPTAPINYTYAASYAE